MNLRLLTLVAIAATLPPRLVAQDAPKTRGCLQPHPADRCAWFPVIELGTLVRLAGGPSGDSRLLLEWNLGFMKNAGARSAVGGVLFASAENNARAGAALRWRRWL